jgi:nucleotide-binding universal stress UspA family protein
MFKRILVTLDGSAMAEQALPFAVNHAKNFQSVLYLIRVVSPLTKSYRTGMASISAIEKTEEQLRVIAQDYLDGIANKLREDNIEVNIGTRIGIPYKEIISFSDQNKIDLIVMCTRGESGFTRWMLGSNTDYVIRGSKVPVLAVPALEVQNENK